MWSRDQRNDGGCDPGDVIRDAISDVVRGRDGGCDPGDVTLVSMLMAGDVRRTPSTHSMVSMRRLE